MEMKNEIKKKDKRSSSYSVYEYERVRLQALKNGHFWNTLVKEVRTKHILPSYGFGGENFLSDFYTHYMRDLNNLNAKSTKDMLVNYEKALDLIVIDELEALIKKYNFQREYIYSMFHFNDYRISSSGIEDIYVYNGETCVPNRDMKKGIYIRYHPLMSQKDILKAHKLASGMVLCSKVKNKEKIQARVYDKERLELYISIESRISEKIIKGVPMRYVLSLACKDVESVIETYTDCSNFYKKYTKALSIPPFNAKI